MNCELISGRSGAAGETTPYKRDEGEYVLFKLRRAQVDTRASLPPVRSVGIFISGSSLDHCDQPAVKLYFSSGFVEKRSPAPAGEKLRAARGESPPQMELLKFCKAFAAVGWDVIAINL